jgi:hypothetical protein
MLNFRFEIERFGVLQNGGCRQTVSSSLLLFLDHSDTDSYYISSPVSRFLLETFPEISARRLWIILKILL